MFLDGDFLVECPARTVWLNQNTDIMPPNRVIFYTDGSQGMVGAGVFSEIQNVNATVFQTKVYAVLSGLTGYWSCFPGSIHVYYFIFSSVSMTSVLNILAESVYNKVRLF
jgi:hypothetical protein